MVQMDSQVCDDNCSRDVAAGQTLGGRQFKLHDVEPRIRQRNAGKPIRLVVATRGQCECNRRHAGLEYRLLGRHPHPFVHRFVSGVLDPAHPSDDFRILANREPPTGKRSFDTAQQDRCHGVGPKRDDAKITEVRVRREFPEPEGLRKARCVRQRAAVDVRYGSNEFRAIGGLVVDGFRIVDPANPEAVLHLGR